LHGSTVPHVPSRYRITLIFGPASRAYMPLAGTVSRIEHASPGRCDHELNLCLCKTGYACPYEIFGSISRELVLPIPHQKML